MGVFKVWEVVGGAAKGGIVVKEAKTLSSAEKPDRLSTGSLVKELSLDGERLQFKKLSGEGPETGWVSLKFKNTDLVCETEKEPPVHLWEVVGGGSQGGILVREGQNTSSKEESSRLSTGAIIKQLDLEGDRLQYKLLTGSGPATGWVSLKLKNNTLVKPSGKTLEELGISSEPAPTTGEPLDIVMSNPDKDFSYEGYQSWVPWVAAVEKLYKEKKPFLPTPVEASSTSHSLKPMEPHKKFNAKQLAEATKKYLPGTMSGLDIPKTVEDMVSDRFGPEWLTKAFHKAGTLPSDNKVAKITECKSLPISGLDTAGGAAMKMFITVEYEKPDPKLHTELFAKYPYLYETHPGPRLECSGFTDVDGAEIRANLELTPLLPFRSAKFYFGDICRETTDWILITERIPFGKRGKFEMGKVSEDPDRKPYEMYPVCGKYQDWLLPDPAEFYLCLFRTLGRMAAWDKTGRFDAFFGKQTQYDEAGYLAATARAPVPKGMPAMIRGTVDKAFGKAIEFLTEDIKTIAPASIQDKTKLLKIKEEVMEMCPYFADMGGYYQQNHSKYIAAGHANLQPDNAFFWRDEYGQLGCGVIDFGAFGRSSVIQTFLGCVMGADASIMMATEEGIIKSFVEEYHRCGGPLLDFDETRLRYHLIYIAAMYDSLQWIERDIMKLTTKEELATFNGTLDEGFQSIFRVRCRTLTIINGFEYYLLRGDFKSTFDKWANGAGKPYLTKYTA